MSKLDELIQKLCPDGVEYLELGEVCNLVTGATPSKTKAEYWENGTIPWMSSGEVNNKFIYSTENKITQAGYESASTTIVPIHSVVIALAGQGKTRGKVAITEIELCTNQSLCSIICGDRLNYKFLYHYLDGKYLDLRSISNGDGARGGLSLKILSPYKIPVPPLEVQREIVRILDNFTDSIEKLQACLNRELECRKTEYAEYSRALFLQSDCIKKTTLEEVVDVCMCKRIKKDQTTTAGEVPFYQNGTLGGEAKLFISNDLFLEFSRKYKFPTEGDVMLSTVGTVGKTVRYDGKPAYFQDSNIVWLKKKLEDVSNEYLYWFCLSKPWKLPERATLKHLHNYMILETEISIPSKERQDFVISMFKQLSEKYESIFKTLTAEIEARRKQYEYYRDKLLTFKEVGA